MNVGIRKANISDSAAFLMLWQFYQYHQSAYDHEDIDENGAFDIDDDYLKNVLKGNEDCEAYFILSGGRIAGFVTLEPTIIAKKEMPELADIFIMPKYRGRGLAKLTIETLLSDFKRWHVAIYEDDVDAYKFWQSMFKKLNTENVEKIMPTETEGFHEYIVVNA